MKSNLLPHLNTHYLKNLKFHLSFSGTNGEDLKINLANLKVFKKKKQCLALYGIFIKNYLLKDTQQMMSTNKVATNVKESNNINALITT